MAKWSTFNLDTDRRLVRGLNEGDEEALIALYDAYAERLYDYCLSLVADSKVAGDTVHDCLIDAARRAPRMRDRMQLRPWLYGATRRRCIQRGRSGGLFWDWDREFTGDRPASRFRPPGDDREDKTDKPGAAKRATDTAGLDAGLSVDEQRELVEAMLSSLDFHEQEALLLALRHGVTGSDLAATLGVSNRRATARLNRALAHADAALTTELRVLSRRCVATKRAEARAAKAAEAEKDSAAGGAPPRKSVVEAASGSIEPAPATLAEHTDDCRDCERRNRITTAALLDLAEPSVPSSALRRRVVHTATDPELAGYRADIAGRGGNLTSRGMPRQPDVPPPFARRWMFAGGGIAGALVSAAVAVLIIGPEGPEIYWPSGPRHKPPVSTTPKLSPYESNAAEPVARRPVAAPQSQGRKVLPKQPPKPRPSGEAPILPGDLSISPASVRLGAGDRLAYVELSAVGGPVSWQAVPSSSQISLSAGQGSIPKGGRSRLTIVFERRLIELEGEAVINVTSTDNPTRTISVSWDGSLLS